MRAIISLSIFALFCFSFLSAASAQDVPSTEALKGLMAEAPSDEGTFVIHVGAEAPAMYEGVAPPPEFTPHGDNQIYFWMFKRGNAHFAGYLIRGNRAVICSLANGQAECWRSEHAMSVPPRRHHKIPIEYLPERAGSVFTP